MKYFSPVVWGFLCFTALAGAGVASDWNQWRGPDRNGVMADSPPLAATWPSDGPRQMWESEAIPSDDDGGHSSVVVSGRRAYVSVVWHTDLPSETRTISDLVMRQLGQQGTGGLGKELVAKMEATREGIPPTLRGKQLDEFVSKWISENLDRKQKELYGGFVGGRFRKGKLAIPLSDYDKLMTRQDKPFASETEFKEWVGSQGLAEQTVAAVLAAVPPTKRVAEDTVVCLDLDTGKTIWKTKSPGEPRGRNCSSTPCIFEGRVLAMGSTHLYCMDADKGGLLWSQPLPAKGPGSSPLAVAGTVVILAGKLAAFDIASGRKTWEQPKVGGNNSSPIAWRKDGKTVVLANSRNEVAAVDLKTGEILWTAPGGGDSTPVTIGDRLVVLTKNPAIGLAAFNLTLAGAEKVWSIPMELVRTQASPLIYAGHVYLMEDGDHFCADLETGKIAWKQKVPSNITSPVLADGKIFVLINNGNNLLMIKATPDDRVELGKANVRALWVPSPCIADGRILLRHRDRIRCYDLQAIGKGDKAL